MIDGPEAKAAQENADRFGQLGFDDLQVLHRPAIRGYTDENQEVWQTLYDRQMAFLESRASNVYLDGARSINLVRDHIPHLDGERSINRFLQELTGWRSCAVPGYLPAKAFFACLAERKFPTTIVIRNREAIDYLPEPDIFHDVFGHVPLHADPVFADFLQTYGRARSAADEADTASGRSSGSPWSSGSSARRPAQALRIRPISSPGRASTPSSRASIEA